MREFDKLRSMVKFCKQSSKPYFGVEVLNLKGRIKHTLVGVEPFVGKLLLWVDKISQQQQTVNSAVPNPSLSL